MMSATTLQACAFVLQYSMAKRCRKQISKNRCWISVKIPEWLMPVNSG